MGWNGAAFDSRRSRLILAGAGGGSDYSGNEVYAFDVDSLKWFRIKDGATTYDDHDTLSPYFFNGTAYPDSQQPRPGYTYDQIEYDSITDQVVIFGLPFAASNGTTWANMFQLNLTTLDWNYPGDVTSGRDGVSARHPSTGKIWFFGRDGAWLSEYDPVMETLTDHGNIWTSAGIDPNQTAAIMPSMNTMISIGTGHAYSWDLSIEGTIENPELETTGCDSLMAVDGPGFQWSPVERKMVGWAGGTHVITMDSTYTCTDIAPNDSNTVVPNAPQITGTYGRWRYVPKYNVFVVVNSTDSSVYLYRPAGGSFAPPDPPVVVITKPSQDTTVASSTIMIHFTVDAVADSLTFDLNPGNNELIVSSTNTGGTGKDTIYVARGTPGGSDPTWPSGASLTATDIRASSLTLSWSAANDDSAVTHYQVYVNGNMVLRLPSSPRTCKVVGLLMNKSYEFRVEALDLRNNISIDGPIRHFSTTNELPPDPATVAPALPKGEVTIMADAAAFLYEGANPIQTGVTEGAMDPIRTVVLRGSVVDIQGDSLPGITISILDHPELGSTVTRSNGQFDMVVNGGGRLVVQYASLNHLMVQREVFPRWQEFELAPTVTMIELDTTVAGVALSDTGMKVARGSTNTDAGGTRRATLLIPSSTTLTLTLPNGSTLTPDSLHIRATEYTVGPHGPKAMPGSLPGTSAYTYAVDFQIEEARALGATSVEFNQPIYSYLENFIGIPEGYPVPVAYYNEKSGVWIPSTDGFVIKISSISSGKANLIVDTTGTPATDAYLDSLGITNAERVRLAGLYSVNQSLWRVPIRHFSAYDYNYPFRLPDDARSPKAKKPRKDEATGKCNTEAGSIINCQNQSLGESVHFPGLPTMNYRSDRVPARRWNRVEIEVTDSYLPPSVDSVRLEVKIGGRKFRYDFEPDQNISYTFEWDGKDAYGRDLQGKQPFSYSIFFGFEIQYTPPRAVPRPTPPGFLLDWMPQTFGLPGAGSFASPVTSQTIYNLSDTYTGYLGVQEINDIGPGWSLENHHSYDPTAGILHMGNGQDRGVESGSGAIYTVAGGGENSDPDGTRAKSADIGRVSEMDVGADGSVYIADRDRALIWKVDTSGIIHSLLPGYVWLDVKEGPDGSLYMSEGLANVIWKMTKDGTASIVAGTGSSSFSGDGGPATSAALYEPANIDVGPDGSLYIADRLNFRIRKVSPSGIIQTVAGTGNYVFNGDSIPATEANMGPGSLAVMDDGTIYISDPYTARIRKIDPTGIITTVAGNGTSGTDGDGGPALEAQIIADRIEVVNSKKGGTLIYLSDEINNTIRVIDEKGFIYRFAGGGYEADKDGIPATSAYLSEPRGTAVDPNGNFYVGRYSGTGIARKILAKLPDYSNQNILIPNPQSGEIFQFSPSGRHLKTFNAFTGKELLHFTYDESGRLTHITDVFNNVTEIERDPGGIPTALVNPYGQTLDLEDDIDGNLAEIVLPSDESYSFSYNVAGLMDAYTTPRGHDYEFTYDSLGRLTRDDDPAGGYKTVTKQDTADGWKTTVSTAMGRSKVYELLPQPDRSTLQRNFDYSGLVTETQWGGNGQITTLAPDTSSTMVFMGPEPQTGLAEMRAKQTIFTTPGGLNSESGSDRRVVLADPDNPLSLVSFEEEAYVNGRYSTTTYQDSTRLWINVSPEGRSDTTLVDSLGRVVEYFTPGAESKTYTYDAHGRLSTISQGSGPQERITTYFYNEEGYLSKVKDANGDSLRFEYDLAGRMIKEILQDGREMNVGYDASGNIDTLYPPGRPGHAFEYTELDLGSRYAPPALGAGTFDTQTGYNLDKQLLEINRPDGKDIEYVYDLAGRIDSILSPLGAHVFSYEALTGRLDSIYAPSGVSLHYDYDGPLPKNIYWSGGISGHISVEYNENLWVTSQVINDTDSVSMDYDLDGRLIQIGDQFLSWNSFGKLESNTLGVVEDSLEFSPFRELEKYHVVADGDTVFEYAFTRDKLGRVIQKTETIQGSTHIYEYAYDLAGRLDTVWVDTTLKSSYAYDSNNNRLRHTHIGGIDSGSYDDQDRLSSYAGENYGYNENGDLQFKVSGGDTTRYHYDVFGNLLSLKLPTGDSISYLIDGSNRRVGKKVNGTLVQGLLYQNQLNPIAELDGSGNIVSRFVYGSKKNVPDQIIKNGEVFRVISDPLGSPRLIINSTSGTVVQQMDFDEFGNVLYDSNPEFQPFGFAGGIYDSHSKLIRFGARDYSSKIGRWTTKDPIGFDGGDPNIYGYVSNNPINMVDPLGKAGVTITNPAVVVTAVVVATVATTIAISTVNDVMSFSKDIFSDWPWWEENVGKPSPQPVDPNQKMKNECIQECLGQNVGKSCGQGHDFFKCVNECMEKKLGL